MMNNTMLFAASVLFWEIGVFGWGTDPLCKVPAKSDDVPAVGSGAAPKKKFLGWYGLVVERALVAALLLCGTAGFSGAALTLAGSIFVGAMVLPLLRLRAVGVNVLAEFELAAHAVMTLVLWQICLHWPTETAWTWVLEGISTEKQAAVCIAAAILIFSLRGGSIVVLGLLAKTGQLPEQLSQPQPPGRKHSASEMIGYVERVIVLLIVAAGNLQALAFFFVAKGLARSKKLEEDPKWANYFLLGSLISFLVALVAGLILQQDFAALWK